MANPPRVGVYIDGFNIYFGLRESKLRKFYWLDMWRLAEKIVLNRQLVLVKYFTAVIKNHPDKAKRQQVYLNALQQYQPSLRVIWGHYELMKCTWGMCGKGCRRPKEKRSDVNIAVQMVLDAVNDLYDVAILVSGDSDLVPAVEAIQALPSRKQVLCGFPPARACPHLARVASGYFHITPTTIGNCQLPLIITRPDGHQYYRPKEWT